ncbi:hypothetical protein NIES4102_12330 [Chondrocystis sp. NIES-4102]|nr:hypothetical protein NIES4102_12330 [Chondrocystis sp. NIES-4102]
MNEQGKNKLIKITVTPQMHQALRLLAAYRNKSLQDCLIGLDQVELYFYPRRKKARIDFTAKFVRDPENEDYTE